MAVAINFVGMEKMMTIPGIGESLAGLILTVRERHGNITVDTLICLTKGKISREAIDGIVFHLMRISEHTGILICLRKRSRKSRTWPNKVQLSQLRLAN